ncbi:hypothetical protein NL108_001545 [Boleophthalmus pectinirostris]|nr:hypothetical protein NL108_001545 [Boleophthalmus pectinirostris]
MDKSIADLLSDAFTESSVPSFPDDDDLDFENLDIKVDGTNLSQDNSTVDQEDSSLMVETASACIYSNEHKLLDTKYNSQENYSSSEKEREEDEIEIDKDFIDQIQSNDYVEFNAAGQNLSQNGLNPNYERCFLNQENTVNKEDITPIPETPSTYSTTYKETFSAINTENIKIKVRAEDCLSSEEERGDDEGEIEQNPGDFLKTIHCSNYSERVYAMGQDLGQKDSTQDSNQEEGEAIEEGGYFGIIQGNEGHLLIQDDSSEEDQTESAKTMFFQVEYTLEYPEMSYDGIDELNEDIDKMEHFSEEEHQEAGESFADYPSDFSSCEYIDSTRNDEPSYFESERDCTTESTTEYECAKQEDIFLKNGAMKDCIGENSDISKEELDKWDITNNQDLCLKLKEKQDNDTLQSWNEDVLSTWSMSEASKGVTADKTDLNVTWEREAETTEENIPNMSQGEICLTGEEVQTTMYSSCGSVDDSFFFNDEPKVYEEMKEGEMEEDEEEERRREQARIQAFYRFYDDQGEDNNKEERQTKVQFCLETLSHVIHYDTDSRELSSSSDEKEEEVEEEELEEEEKEEKKEEEEEKKEEEGEEEAEEEEKKEEEGEEEAEEEEKKEEEGEEEAEEEEKKEEEGEEVEGEEEGGEEEIEGEVEGEDEEVEGGEEGEDEEDGNNQTYEVETCPSVSSDEEVLSSSQELEEVEDSTLMDLPNLQEIPDQITESINKPACNRNHRSFVVMKSILSLFLVVVMGLIMFWWVTDAEEWLNFAL